MRRPTVTAIGVGIPARDEATTIASTLRSVATAGARCGLPVAVAVAADSCTDDTAALAADALAAAPHLAAHVVIEVESGAAGAARDAACRAALRALTALGHGLPDVWLATTDADSTVPGDWLGTHVGWAELGADGVAGQVRLDRSAPLRLRARTRRHLARLGTGHGHPHVHGANLGVRADVWHRAGGFPHVVVGEDQALWRVLADRGANLVAAPNGVVTTSGRLVGRAPDGFAAVLSGLVG